MDIQKYIDVRTTTKEEKATSMGSGRAFASGGLDSYIRIIAEKERRIKELSKDRRKRSFMSFYRAAISSIHKRGCYTFLGQSCKRTILPSEFCMKLKKLSHNFNILDNQQKSLFIYFIKKLGTSRECKKKTKIFIHWETMKKLNRLTKDLKLND